jgi:hypothetical protein
MLGVLLKDSDANHGDHHSDGADLEPGLATDAVEKEDGNPREDEEDDADTARREVCGVGVGDAALFKERRLKPVSHEASHIRAEILLPYSIEWNLCQ